MLAPSMVVGIDVVPPPKKPRRPRTPWTEGEVAALDLGVRTFGEGRWEVVLDTYAARFQAVRTVADLKDKWRHMQRQGAAA